jgi:L-seryl-tRNA(Ser) seleniumtransferase
MTASEQDIRRRIAGTDVLLGDPRSVAAIERFGRDRVKAAIVAAQNQARRAEIAPEDALDVALMQVEGLPSELRPALNATGVIVHTNLGRAPLSPAACGALIAAAGCTDVEFDLPTGQRARRGAGALSALAEAVPNADAVHVVNNNAAALLLCALVLAGGREIVVSRGELVEIGDGFRIPDLLASTGARLREVGTTNRTHLADYADAIGPDTGFVLKVHPSNFQVTGFTSDVSVAELAGLGAPVVADIGSASARCSG